MGCYLSCPDNRVYITEGQGKNFRYATASCQGWRREQEDAEVCLPYYDENSSLFVLCDGHGGAEVAKYTVEHFPDFLKNHQLYKAGKYEEALEKALLDFDLHLRSEEVMEQLHKMAFDEEEQGKEKMLSDDQGDNENQGEHEGAKKQEAPKPSNVGSSSASSASSSKVQSLEQPGPSSSKGPSTVVEDVDTETLRKEAQVPLRQLLEQYASTGAIDPAKRNSLLAKYNSSPVVKQKPDDDEDEAEAVQGSNEKKIARASLDSQGDEPTPSSSTSENPENISKESIKDSLIRQVLQHYFDGDAGDSSDDSEYNGDESEDGDDEGEGDDADTSISSKKQRKRKIKEFADHQMTSSEEDEEDLEEEDSETESSEDDEEDDEGEDDEDEDDEDEDEDEGEDEDEENKVSAGVANDEEEDCDDEEVDREKAPEGDDDNDDDDDDDDDSWEDLKQVVRPMCRNHTPGLDSGCTVVVALIKDGKLYVASAGDSRCIMIMRDGECKPMSFDHKPESMTEKRRIFSAGGRVTDGRVNGGLNLSRALGDFSYKDENLSQRDQMITACPDVRVADLNPEQVEYIFLACDGIWNSMKNQRATKFIRKTAKTVNDNLVDICVHLFRECIAPATEGDGTGCDNMTCILAQFSPDGVVREQREEDVDQVITSSQVGEENKDLKKQERTDSEKTQPDEAGASTSNKRLTASEESEDVPKKRRCLRL